MTTTETTAATAYLAAVAEARSLLARAENALDVSPVRGVDWGHVGSANAAVAALREAVGTLENLS